MPASCAELAGRVYCTKQHPFPLQAIWPHTDWQQLYSNFCDSFLDGRMICLSALYTGYNQLRRPPEGANCSCHGRQPGAAFGTGGSRKTYCIYHNTQAYPAYLVYFDPS